MSTNLKPFFCYYGGKWRAAPHYPHPRHETIIEPFAGAAGYSTRHPQHKVQLYDTDPTIVSVWEYLIRATESEILGLPDVFDEIPQHLPQEAKWLIGFWLNKGTTRPSKTPSAWMRGGTHADSFWGPAIRARLAGQVGVIRHWQVSERSYKDVEQQEATWFVDPPYSGTAGRHYRHNSIDFAALGAWCKDLKGQVIVCENQGATWLPFQPFKEIKANESRTGGKRSAEVVWLSRPSP